jgi:hypothetical protein
MFFKTIGGYKPSIKLTFNYEFLLRFTNTGRNIMVIPKMGYKHTNMRQVLYSGNIKIVQMNHSEYNQVKLISGWKPLKKNTSLTKTET